MPPNPIIAVVDDERVIADTIAIILRHHGYNVVVGYNGEQALALAREHQPGLMLINVGMWDPPLNGVEAAGKIRGEFPDTRIVMHTGSNAKKAKEQGFTEILLKPIHPQLLLDFLRDLGIPKESG